MRNLVLGIIMFSAFGSFAQSSHEEILKNLFFNLDIDASDDVLVGQIEKHPSIHFVSTGKVDTLSVVGSNVYLMNTPKVFGMPEYKMVDLSLDHLKADSTFLFLGGGAGFQMSCHDLENPQYYTLETVEINRYFSDAETSSQLYSLICEELTELVPDADVFDWSQEDRSSYTMTLSGTQHPMEMIDKKLVVEYYQLSEEINPTYIIRVSYEKSIPNEVI